MGLLDAFEEGVACCDAVDIEDGDEEKVNILGDGEGRVGFGGLLGTGTGGRG